MKREGKEKARQCNMHEATIEKLALLMKNCGSPCEIESVEVWMRRQPELENWCNRRCGNVPEWRCWKSFFMVKAGLKINKKKRKKMGEEKQRNDGKT